MDFNQTYWTIQAMRNSRRAFHRQLAEALVHAHNAEQSIIFNALPELAEKFGPGSKAYQTAGGMQ